MPLLFSQKYYRSANCIFAKLGNLNPPVTLHLVHSIALPTLACAIEALPLTKTQIISLQHPWLCMFMKVFKTFDKSIVHKCQCLSDILPIRHVYTIRRMSFLTNFETSKNLLLCPIHAVTNENYNVIGMVADRYNCNIVRFTEKYNLALRNQFKLESLD